MARNPGRIALKYLMCSKEMKHVDALAIKYLMCSKEADLQMKDGDAVSVKYLMCSKELGKVQQ